MNHSLFSLCLIKINNAGKILSILVNYNQEINHDFHILEYGDGAIFSSYY